VPKNWCFQSVGLKKTLENPLGFKEIKPANPKGNKPWVFIRRTDYEAGDPKLWPPDEKNWLIGKDSDSGKDRRWEEKRMTEDEMVGWHHRLNGHEICRILVPWPEIEPSSPHGKQSLSQGSLPQYFTNLYLYIYICVCVCVCMCVCVCVPISQGTLLLSKIF